MISILIQRTKDTLIERFEFSEISQELSQLSKRLNSARLNL